VNELFAEIRAAAARVAASARSVQLDEGALAALAARMAAEPPPRLAWDPTTHHRGGPGSTLAYVITLDAVNFGSGWFPLLRKRAGRSGYYTVAIGLKERFDGEGPWSAAELAELDAAAIARVLGQTLEHPEVAELMALFARALGDLGELLLGRYGGRFEGLVEEAGGSAARLVRALARMPLYQDVARYDGVPVPFYKRAQITAADLALAFEGRGPGRFGDLDELTCFADNLVPHVLRWQRVLRYEPELAEAIEQGRLLAAGSPEEVEIRALGLHAVERLVAELRRLGRRVSAQQIDMALWHAGQKPEIKAHPRHRARCSYY
jgi:hypothetical protein